MELVLCQQIFEERKKNLMKIRPVGADYSLRTDTTKQTVVFRNFALISEL
jgi:hypothetical protein